MKDLLLQKIANTLLLNIQNIDNQGLFNGKMGIVIFLYHYTQYSGITVYSDVADDLIDEISDSLSSDGPVDFETGLTGIGWGFQYLLDNKFVKGDADNILSEVDECIFNNISKENVFSLLSSNLHLFGHGLYFLSREKNRILSREKTKILKIMLNGIDKLLKHDSAHLSASFYHSVLYFIQSLTYEKQIKRNIERKVCEKISSIELTHTREAHTSLEDYSQLLWQNILYSSAKTYIKEKKINLIEFMTNEKFEDIEKLSVVGLNLMPKFSFNEFHGVQ